MMDDLKYMNKTTPREICCYGDVFDAADTNADGYLSKEELAELLKSKGQSDRTEALFDFCDRNEDQKISRAEFLQGIIGIPIEDQLIKFCRHLDRNRNGLIGAQQFIDLLTECGIEGAEKNEGFKEINGRVKYEKTIRYLSKSTLH